jgi:hypothetical protein
MQNFARNNVQLLRSLSPLSVAWVCFIFALAPTARYLLSILRTYLSSEQIFIGGGLILVIAIARARALSFTNWLYILIPLITGYFTFSIAEERFHLLLFGVLGLLFMRDARSSGVDASYAFFLGTCIGILDELFQAVLPNRVGDIRDVVINSIGVAWGVLLAKSLQKSSMQKDNLG